VDFWARIQIPSGGRHLWRILRPSKAVHRYANALDMWEEARTLTRAASDRQSRSVADYALAEWRELALNPGNSKVPNASG
jgi:hypothetical protein